MAIFKFLEFKFPCPECKTERTFNVSELAGGHASCSNCKREFTKEEVIAFVREVGLKSRGDENLGTRPANTKIEITKTDEHFRADFPNGKIGCTGVFLLFFVTIWIIGVFSGLAGMLGEIIKDPSQAWNILFFLPFLAFISIFTYFVLASLNTKNSIYFDNGQLVIKKTVYKKEKLRSISINDIKKIETDFYTTKNSGRSYFVRISIKKRDKFNNLTGKDGSIQFSNTFTNPLTGNECYYLTKELNERIALMVVSGVKTQPLWEARNDSNTPKASREFDGKKEPVKMSDQEYAYNIKDSDPHVINKQPYFHEEGAHGVRLSWIVASVVISLPFFMVANFLIFPFIAALPVFFIVGFAIARLSPGRTFIEPAISSILVSLMSLTASIYIFKTGQDGFIYKFVMRASDIWYTYFPIPVENIADSILIMRSIIYLHITLALAGAIVSLIGAYLGEKMQMSSEDKFIPMR